MSIDPVVLLALVTEIQAASLDPDRWRFVLETIRSIFGGVAVQMSGFDIFRGAAYSGVGIGYDPDFIASFDRYYGRINPIAFRDPPIARTFSLDQVIPHDDLARTEFWADWLRPQADLSAGGGLLLPAGPGRLVSFGGGIRRCDQERLEAPFLALVDAIRPLVQKAVAINGAMAQRNLETCLLRNGVEPEGAAVLVVDADRRPCVVNPRAGQLLAESKALLFRGDGRIGLPDVGAENRLACAMTGRTCLGEIGFSDVEGRRAMCRMVRIDGRMAELVPFPNTLFVVPPVFVMVVTTDRSEGDPAADLARKAGLTRNEAEIALAVAEGATLASIAEQRGRSLSTIRNQLQAIFEKTGSHRQADLVRLVERLRRSG